MDDNEYEYTDDDVTSDPLDLTHANAALFAAIAEAQDRAETVGKDARNDHGSYNYATAEAMIRAGRACRKGTGLALICTSTLAHAPPQNRPDVKQWVSHTITTHWALVHKDGGYIRGRSEIDAIASARRPNDKAAKAAETYLHGFIERDLFELDRAEEEKDAVDRRGDEDYQPQQGGQRRTQQRQSKPQGKRGGTGNEKLDRLANAVKLKYQQCGGNKWLPWSDLLKEASAGPEINFDNLRKVNDYLKAELAKHETEDETPDEEGGSPPTGIAAVQDAIKRYEEACAKAEREPDVDAICKQVTGKLWKPTNKYSGSQLAELGKELTLAAEMVESEAGGEQEGLSFQSGGQNDAA